MVSIRTIISIMHVTKEHNLYLRRRPFLRKSPSHEPFIEPFISSAHFNIAPLFPKAHNHAVRAMNTNCQVSEVAELQCFPTCFFTSLMLACFSGKKQGLKHEVHLKVRRLHETNALTYSPQRIPHLHPNHHTHTANLQPRCQK